MIIENRNDTIVKNLIIIKCKFIKLKQLIIFDAYKPSTS